MFARTRPRARSARGFDGPTSRSVEREMEREQRRLVEERLVGETCVHAVSLVKKENEKPKRN
jgi:hypothetical protein